ncbi:MAG: hypothetical protein LUD84_01855 [Clostridiales bacterium]|nr:hypothetical protein [Clostridiales bacterium]
MTVHDLFKKDKAPATPMLHYNFTPVSLPDKGDPDLSSIISGEYSLNSDTYQAECLHRMEEQLAPQIQNTDGFTRGDAFDSDIDVQMLWEENKFQEEVALHEVQGGRITKAREVRTGEIDRELPQVESKIQQLNEEIAPLEGKHSHYTLHLGRKLRVSMGLVVTILAMVFDAYVNYSFLENILLQAQWMLIIVVLGLSLTSDLTTCVAGILYSQQDESAQDKKRSYISGVLIGFYVLSSVISCFMRFGSMDTTFITLPGEEPVSIVTQYSLTLMTSLITPTTGYICLLLSLDRDGALESRRLRLEAERDALLQHYSELLAERQALELAVDPMIRDRECREAARKNLEALRLTLKLHVRAMLALQMQDAAYTDAMTQSAQELLDSISNETQPTDNIPDDNVSEPDLKEVI